jgi:hypothetical protein
MSDLTPVDTAEERRARPRRTVFAAAFAVLAIVAVPLALLAFDGGSNSVRSPRKLVDSDPVAAVRAAVGQTMAAGNYEMDTVSTSTSGPNTSCGGGEVGSGVYSPGATFAERPTVCMTLPPSTSRFETHGIVNFEPYAMMSQTQASGLGAITTHINSTRVWQLGGATVGYGAGNPGILITDYTRQVVGTIGRGPGALAMLSLASRGGYLNLEEESVATAQPAGTGTVRDIPVTYYDVTIDVKKLADAPDLSDVQRATIAAAVPMLEQAGYTGTKERIGIDDQGYIRQVDATTTFSDGSSMVRHSVLYNFGCAPKVTMPNEPPAAPTTTPCAPPPTTAPPTSVPPTTVPATTATTATTTTTTTLPATTTTTVTSP